MNGINVNKSYAKDRLKNLGKEGALYSCDEEVQKKYLKYNALLLSYLYYRQNKLNYDGEVLNNKKKRRIKTSVCSIIENISKERLEKINKCFGIYGKKCINKSGISFPLFAMEKYIEENLDTLKEGNHRQLDFANQFGLDHLQNVKNIVEILGYNDVLNWKTINLSTRIFSELVGKHKQYKKNIKFDKNLSKTHWNEFVLSFISTFTGESYEAVSSGLRALGVSKDDGLMSVKIPSVMTWQILTYFQNEYIPKKYKGDVTSLFVYEEDINHLYKIFKDDLTGIKKQVKSNIRGLLRAFGYNIVKK